MARTLGGCQDGMAKPDCSAPKELALMEQEKRREYGLGPSNPSTLFDGLYDHL